MMVPLGAVTENPVSLVFVPKGATISVTKLPLTITVMGRGTLEVPVVKPFPKYPAITLF